MLVGFQAAVTITETTRLKSAKHGDYWTACNKLRRF